MALLVFSGVQQMCIGRPPTHPWRRCVKYPYSKQTQGDAVPIYEYACKACNHQFEQLVRTMNGSEKMKCPQCGSTQTARALSVFAVGAEGSKSSGAPSAQGGCGRCGGPGPCASGY